MLTDDLRTTFLFEKLTDEQLNTLVSLGQEVTHPPGVTLFTEGEPAEILWVLLDGEIELSRWVRGQRLPVMAMNRRGVYAGGLLVIGEAMGSTGYLASGRTVSETRLFTLPSVELGRMMTEWYPMARHLLDGYSRAFRTIGALVEQREYLVALGALAAGMAHEINNPAAAVQRAASSLRTAVSGLQTDLRLLAQSDLSSAQLGRLVELHEDALERLRTAEKLGPIAASDMEEEITIWLEAHDIPNAWELAPALMAAGLGPAWLDDVAGEFKGTRLLPAIDWIVNSLSSTHLFDQIQDCTTRISDLVSAIKAYSFMDQSMEQEIDIHDGLESTLIMLRHRLTDGIEIVRQYDRSLPRISAYGSELNQIWTNILNNAIDAVNQSGRITIRTAHELDAVLVHITDNGPGIPADMIHRIYEPFFTTKEIGQGTGLGLDIARRAVVERHNGELSCTSIPGNTCFTVRLPIGST